MERTLVSSDNAALCLQPGLSAAPDIHRSAEEFSFNLRQGQRSMNKLSLGKCLFLDVLSTPLSWTFYFYTNKSLQDGYEVLELLCLEKETCLGTLPRPSLARLMAICGDTASVDDNFKRRKQMNSVSVPG